MEELRQIIGSWQLQPLAADTVQDNVWKVYTEEGVYALKNSRLEEKRLFFIANAQRTLVRNGFQKFAHAIDMSPGQPFFRQGKDHFCLSEWVEGEPCDFNCPRHLLAAGKTLGEFHLYSRNISSFQGAEGRVSYFRWPEKFASRTGDLEDFAFLAKAKKHPNAFEQMYLSHYESFREQARSARRLLFTSDYARLAREAAQVKSFIHYDVAARNFIIQGELAYLIDFDYCALDLPAVDLMRLIKRALKDGYAAREKLMTILSGYQSMRRVTKSEFQLIYALLFFPQKFWRLSQRYFCQAHTWSDETFARKMEGTIRELGYEEKWLPLYRDICESGAWS